MKKVLKTTKKVLSEMLKCFLSMVIFVEKGAFALVMLIVGVLLIAPLAAVSNVLDGKGSLWRNYESTLSTVLDASKDLLD